uniref:Coiled-coil domain-containing protein 86 n=1 Tax=Trichuris muris TaxID=70415 RepID=A0A5S6QXA3_TRIMR
MEELDAEELPCVEERMPVRGVPKSGRTWKTCQSKATKHKAVRSSWRKKISVRDATAKVKEMERRILDDRAKMIEEKKRKLKEREERRLANERKAEVVQVIKNSAKLKRMKKKQLRMIRKADTTEIKASNGVQSIKAL